MDVFQKNYHTLFELSRHISTLKSILSLLHWDQETYMPEEGAKDRGTQIEAISGIIHMQQTSGDYEKALAHLVDLENGIVKEGSLDERQKAAVYQWYRDWKREASLPAEFVKRFSKLTSEAQVVWSKAKNLSEFDLFEPYLEEIVDMEREKADYLGWEEHPYDALVDLYEPGITTKKIEQLFSTLQSFTCELLHFIKQSNQIDDRFLHGSFSTEKQLEFSRKLLKDMGFHSSFGRLDVSSHPFSTAIGSKDHRITTRINPDWIISNILVVLHEGGHSLYEMGLPQEEFGSPLGQAISIGMHECQSRFWETRIGQSRSFWEHYYPILQNFFPKNLKSVSLDNFYRALNKVAPSFIRVDADEVTYPLHVILRFRMEKALIEGSLKVKDIPQTWNRLMEELLGITPSDDRFGCLQDIHWAMGGFGYFPAYTLGTIYASQFFEAFSKDYPDWRSRIASGQLSFIYDWMKDSVHQYGRQYDSPSLIKKITGYDLSVEPYCTYLKNKYIEVYESATSNP